MTNEEDHNISTVSYSSKVFSKKRKNVLINQTTIKTKTNQ